MTDPTTLTACGLPASSSQFTSESRITTFNLTADCTYDQWSAQAGNALLYFTSGAFTINGNGHTISGPPHTYTIFATGANTRLNLNNVIIRGGGALTVVNLRSGARLDASNVIFRDNVSRAALSVDNPNTQAVLRNVQFLSNRQPASGTQILVSALAAGARSTVTITNGIFRGNRNTASASLFYDRSDTILAAGATITLQGCITFAGNLKSDGSAADDYGAITNGGVDGTVNDRNTGACPAEGFVFPQLPKKKSKETATPRPSATTRPLATTCIDLNQATGIAVRATYGLASGVQCQRLDGGGIGVQAIVDGGFIDAVDIWGYVEQGVEVCFPQAGELLFLDARTMPRAIAPLASTVVNGMTCGAIETPGSIVLMPLP